MPETHLHLCQINTGEEELRQVVCGAPNIKAGIKVMVALPGARIADNYKIKKGKIRGMESLGMVCSLQELGISDSVIPKEFSDGIQILPENAVSGQSVFSYLDLDDEIIELSITPNRADALSMRGVAHEVAAIYDSQVHFEKAELVEVDKAASDVIEVAIESDQVVTYQARVIENVQVAPSPQWLQNLLMNAGIRPINNVVDVTNYILLYFGQPMHAFDLDKFTDKKITARQANNGETLVTLDDVERELVADNIVISVGGQAVALGGVMGGASTEIDNGSTNVVLEAALFNGKSIRKTSGRLNLRSESSSRFEKGINVADLAEALDTAAAMIAALAGGQVLAGVVKAGQVDTNPVPVTAKIDYVNRSLGTDLQYAQIETIFHRLGMEIAPGDGEKPKLLDRLEMALTDQVEEFTVQVPRRRWDITSPADLVEEIARIYGYNNLPTPLPKEDGTAGELTPSQRLRRQVRTVAEGAGLTEIISYALTTPEKAVEFSVAPTTVTELMWTMTVDRSALRQNMVSGMLEIVAYNVARKQKNLAFYEIGKVFEQVGNPKEDLPQEISKFSLALTGLVVEKDFQTTAVPVDFYHAKGIVEALLAKFGLRASFTANNSVAALHPGRTAVISLGEAVIGFVGQVHPQTSKNYGIPETYVAELNLDAIEAAIQPAPAFQEISKFPAVSRDIALLLDQTVEHSEIMAAITSANVKRLTNVTLFDVYAGSNIESGKKSMAYSLTFQNPSDNLTDEEVAGYMAKISTALENLGAEIR
ncbi:phenylalanine--tRNA ligase subunit beta [Streptococcus sp. X13SY08]|uniref:phenylalanine--tRNA ligase subunit beta n=1 Tax=Streptococcus sp. X13SY08 TaxID=1676616 RepID=UPI000AFC2EF1